MRSFAPLRNDLIISIFCFTPAGSSFVFTSRGKVNPSSFIIFLTFSRSSLIGSLNLSSGVPRMIFSTALNSGTNVES